MTLLLTFTCQQHSRIAVAGFSRAAVPSATTAAAGFSKGRPISRRSATFLDELTTNFWNTFSTMSNQGPSSSSSKYFTIGITGSGGCVGTALRDELSKRDTVNGKPVRIVRLARGTVAEQKDLLEDETKGGEIRLQWNPMASSPEEVIDPAALAEMDAIIHLSGENVASGLGFLGFLGLRPWTDAKKEEIINSRVITTSALAKAMAALPSSSSSFPKSFLVASGIDAYGANFIGNALDAVDESMDISSSGGFLAEVSRQWEAASAPAQGKKNLRVVNMRFGVVLSTKGGALAKLYPIFLLGGGGIVGSGDQYFSFISARDHARAIVHTLETPTLQGPVNFCAPNPCTNAEFTSALGKVVSRPTILPLPSFAVSTLFGEMGEEMLLGGTRVVPSKLIKSGFQFEHPTIEQALQSAVKESI